MTYARLTSMTMLLVASLGSSFDSHVVAAQTPKDSAAADSTPKKSGRFGGLMNKAKSMAHNEAIQGAAKGVACTVVPGAAISAATGTGPCANSGLVGGLMSATGKGASVMSAAGAMGAVTGLSNSAAQAAAMKIMKTSGMNGLSNSAAQSAAMKVMMGNGMSNVMAQQALSQMMKNQAAAQAVGSPADAAAAMQMLQNMGLAGMMGGKPGKPGKAPAVATVATAAAAAAPAAVPAANAWESYDFVPGERVIFYTDFSDGQAGNFPDRLQFGEGNMDVMETGGRRLMRITSESKLNIPLSEVLPQRFTIEIDFINRPSLDGGAFYLRGNVGRMDDSKTSIVGWGSAGVSLMGGGGGEVRLANTEALKARYRGKPAQLRILGDGKYIKIYLDEKKLANVPNANFERSNLLHLSVGTTSEQNPAYISRIRISESRKSLYDDLAASGRVATQGFLFDNGSDQLRPESAPTLRQIAAMIEQHPELRLRIEGYSDNAGDKGANQKLSEKRAAAVKAALISQYHVNGGRLDSKGLGDNKPVGNNATADGRANNRRVELVKM